MTARLEGTLPPGRRPPLAGIPDYLWTPVAAGLLTLLCGLLGLATHQMLLFPSIGPTAFLLAHSPNEQSSRVWNVIVGYTIGLAAAYVALALLRGNDAPALFAVHALAPVRVWASALAVALSLAGQIALRASHAPAAATTLLVALGGFRPTLHDASAVIAGVVLLAIGGELLRIVHARVDAAHAQHARSDRAPSSVGQAPGNANRGG